MARLGQAQERGDSSSVWTGGSLMDCMQWQGLRAEMSRGHRTSLCLPVNHSIRSQEARKTPRSDP